MEVTAFRKTASPQNRKCGITPFPYETGPRLRRVVGKPEQYRGWTIWHYQAWCQQTGAAHGEWRDLTLAAVGADVIVSGGIHQAINRFRR